MRTERQAHGFIFQNWVLRTFLDLAYSGEWDIPSKINPITKKPVSIKTAQWETGGVSFGDALNQFNVNEDFEIVVAFYEIRGNKKKVVNMQLVPITKEKWREMWGNMTIKKLEEFDNLVRCEDGRSLEGQKLNDFRDDVQKKKEIMLEGYTGKFSIHPKIDSKNQRRVQCSIPFNTFFKEFGLEDKKKKFTTYTLWGKEIKLSSIKLDN